MGLEQITRDNRWYGRLLGAIKQSYPKKARRQLIDDLNSDIEVFGYEYARQRWAGFLAPHYPEESKGAETLPEEKTQPPSKARAHIQYRLQDGTLAPGVTTVLSILAKPALIEWAWNLGRQGLDYREVRNTAGDIGTLAHFMIMCHLKGETPDTSEYSPAEVAKAENCLGKFRNWLREHPISPVMIETPLVSEEFRFGGTPDLLAELDGELTLIDLKTGSSGIYPEMMYQLAAYWQLLEEQGWPIASARILRMSRDGDDFEERIRTELETEWRIFEHCLALYQLQGQLR